MLILICGCSSAVESQLPKLVVAGSNPVARSKILFQDHSTLFTLFSFNLNVYIHQLFYSPYVCNEVSCNLCSSKRRWAISKGYIRNNLVSKMRVHSPFGFMIIKEILTRLPCYIFSTLPNRTE